MRLLSVLSTSVALTEGFKHAFLRKQAQQGKCGEEPSIAEACDGLDPAGKSFNYESAEFPNDVRTDIEHAGDDESQGGSHGERIRAAQEAMRLEWQNKLQATHECVVKTQELHDFFVCESSRCKRPYMQVGDQHICPTDPKYCPGPDSFSKMPAARCANRLRTMVDNVKEALDGRQAQEEQISVGKQTVEEVTSL